MADQEQSQTGQSRGRRQSPRGGGQKTFPLASFKKFIQVVKANPDFFNFWLLLPPEFQLIAVQAEENCLDYLELLRQSFQISTQSQISAKAQLTDERRQAFRELVAAIIKLSSSDNEMADLFQELFAVLEEAEQKNNPTELEAIVRGGSKGVIMLYARKKQREAKLPQTFLQWRKTNLERRWKE